MDNKISFWEKVFSKRGYKFLLFFVSYVLAVAVTVIIFGILERNFHDIGSNFLYGLYFFPLGFGWPIFTVDVSIFTVDVSDDSPVFSIGMIIYILITLCAVVVKNSRTVKILYIIFVLLLIFNFGGCVAMAIEHS